MVHIEEVEPPSASSESYGGLENLTEAYFPDTSDFFQGAPGFGAATFGENQTVFVQGLKSKPELNGKQVRVVDYDHGKARYNVALESGEVVALKAANLSATDPKSDTSATPPPPRTTAEAEWANRTSQADDSRTAQAQPDSADVAGPSDTGDPDDEDEGPAMDPEEERQLLEQARDAKDRGNEHFKAGRLPEALECYSEAIEIAAVTENAEVGVFFANRAAVFAKTGKHQAVIDDCDAALARQPDYVKALMRRAQASEALDKPDSALADMRRVTELDPSNKQAKAAVPRLEAAANAKLEQQKEEMMGKLKDLGNSILGKFGMSLDNFNAVKDPETGAYSISMNTGK